MATAGQRLRIVTQEPQKGGPWVKPNLMINGHQDWLDGLVGHARRLRSPA